MGRANCQSCVRLFAYEWSCHWRVGGEGEGSKICPRSVFGAIEEVMYLYLVSGMLQEQGSAWQGLACSQGSGVTERGR